MEGGEVTSPPLLDSRTSPGLLAFIHLWWVVRACHPPLSSVLGYRNLPPAGQLAALCRMPATQSAQKVPGCCWSLLKVGRGELPPRKWQNGSGCVQPK